MGSQIPRRFAPNVFPLWKFIDLGQGGKPTWGVAVGTQHIQAAAAAKAALGSGDSCGLYGWM